MGKLNPNIILEIFRYVKRNSFEKFLLKAAEKFGNAKYEKDLGIKFNIPTIEKAAP